ncbi:MAG: S8 family serine peptidase [Steroidobacter sp.]
MLAAGAGHTQARRTNTVGNTQIHIAGYSFDPADGEPDVSNALRARAQPSGMQWWLVQLRHSPTRTERTQLAAQFALQLERYVPNHAYIERVDSSAVARLRQHPAVRAVVPYHPAFKLSPLIGKLKFTTAERQAMGFRLIATTFAGTDPQAIATRLQQLGATSVEVRTRPQQKNPAASPRTKTIATGERIAFTLAPGTSLENYAGIEGVRWIEEFPERKEDNGNTAGTIQSGTPGTTPIWNMGIHGENQIVGVIDSGGVDINHCMFEDPVDNTARPDHRKMLEVRGAAGTHATFVGGIVAGDDFNTPGTGANRGNAWAARLVSGLKSEDMDDALNANMEQGAFIHTNSWHDNTGNPAIYNQTAEDVDTFTFNNEDHLVLGSMGNNGEEQGPPGTAKNAIGVQATMRDPNENSFGDGNDGPTADGRRKPDISSPGCQIRSAQVSTACTIDLDENIFSITGPVCATSWATPSVAAAAALVRQYYTEGWYPSGAKQPHNSFRPSGALLKATLLNGTLNMTGPAGYPSDTEGWGVLRLEDSLFFSGDPRNLRVWDVRNSSGLATGESQTYIATISATAQPLKVTLAWSDAPGNSGDANPVVNNLDLTVISPDGTRTFLGNQFGAGGSSNTGGSADTLNNVEQVLVNNPAVGNWTIRVTGAAVNVGAPGQGYALVVTSDSPEPPVPTGTQNTLVVRVSLPDVLAGSAPSAPTVQNLLNDLATYINEVSYGQATVDALLFPSAVNLTNTKSHYFAPSRNPLVEMTQDVVTAVLGIDANIFNRGTASEADDIDRMILVLNDPSFTEDWSTTGPWPYDLPNGLTRPISVSIQTTFNNPEARWAHGMGHQLGMWDLGPHPHVAFAQPHVDEWDNMAHAFLQPHEMAWSKERATWLTADGSAPMYIPRPAAGASFNDTIDLNFLTDTNGRRAIAIGMTEGAASLAQEDAFFWIEARSNAAGSFDNVLPESGVLVYSVEENVPQGEGPVRILDENLTTTTLTDAALEVGDSSAPPGRGLNVTVQAGASGSDRRIQIAYDPPETDNDPRMAAGDPVWASPDIWVDSQRDGFDEDNGRTPEDRGDQAVEGEVNRLYFRITNPGPGSAFDFMARVRVSEPYHTVGGEAGFNRFAGEVHIDEIAAGATIVRYVEWIPDEDGNPHSCVEVTFPNVFNDVNLHNNRAQKNLEEVTSSHGSPYEARTYNFGLTNEEDHQQLYYFRAESVPEGWSKTLTPLSALLSAGERVDGTFTVQPPPNAVECTNHRMNITSWKASGDTLVPVGGGAFQVDLRSKTVLGLDTGVARCPSKPTTHLASSAARYQNQCLTITAQGCTNPPRPNEKIIVRYETPDGVPVYHEVMTDANGCYSDFLVVPEGGPWQVTAEYPGGECSGGDTTRPSDVLVSLPTSDDTDGDGVPDPEEPQGDHDRDGIPGFLDPDSDNDGVPDGEEGTGDCDKDGVRDIVDADSDNDGIPDGRDKPVCGGGAADPKPGDSKRRIAASFHVGSAHPLGDFDEHADANIYVAIDGTYRLNDRINLVGTMGLAQFTEETSTGADNQRIAHLSINAQALFPTSTPTQWYLQAGPGVYDRKIGGTDAGFNLGLGALYPLTSSISLQWGADLHRLFGGRDDTFYTLHLGVLWR